MKMLGIRQYMLVGMLTFFVLPSLAYGITDLLDRRVLQPQSPQQQDQALAVARREIVENAARWHDPQWQDSIRNTLNTLNAGVVIRGPSGAEILRAGHVLSAHRSGWWSGISPSEQTMVVEGGQELGAVDLFVPLRDDGLARAAAAIALVLALLNVGWQMRRSVVKPLEAMGRAARRIAGGNLDFALPESRVREIAAVRAAFQAMGDGLRESIGRQAALEEERRFFVGAIAHDLRTPLFTLRGSLVGLEQGLATSPEKTARYVAVCRQKADQLDRLVDDLFAYTKAEYLEQTLRRERLDLGLLLVRAVDDLQPRARAKGVHIERDGPDDCPALAGDAHLVGRAIGNLLDNALRHTPPEGRIAVRWQAEPDRLIFTVADTGPGIAAPDLPHLFEPLYRGEASRSRETGGAGLGLTIARRILRAHGGDLVAENEPAGGAAFTGWLPLSAEC
ncbi:MAG: HAMP domain-containing histidine kinase [Chloroflexota bacterium]|nr:HAMP domain-containing histidine kinase [Chloroflexota bacterium]